MKLTALHSIKFKKLKRRLSLAHWQAVGLLESLWLFTQANAIEGDIGRHSDEDIAAAIEWDDDAGELIETLVELRLLDRCPVHRLIVHGWEEHAPTFIKGVISRHGKGFAKPAKEATKQPTKEAAEQGTSQATTTPILTMPCLAKPSGGEPCAAAADAAPPPPANDSRPKKKRQTLADVRPVGGKRRG